MKRHCTNCKKRNTNGPNKTCSYEPKPGTMSALTMDCWEGEELHTIDEFEKSFPKCPCCGSSNRFFESLAKEAKSTGTTRPNWTMFLDVKNGVAMDKARDPMIPIGTELPGYYITTDICADCGNIYATALKTYKVIKSLVPPTLLIPGMGQNNPKLG